MPMTSLRRHCTLRALVHNDAVTGVVILLAACSAATTEGDARGASSGEELQCV